LEKEFLTLMGEFTVAESSGVRISRFLQQGAIDYKAALKVLKPALPDSELESESAQACRARAHHGASRGGPTHRGTVRTGSTEKGRRIGLLVLSADAE
jgi:hypothetical protein